MKPKLSKLKKRQADVNSTYWRARADKVWSEVVRNRAGNKCEVCRSADHVQAHHLVDRSVWQLRHDVENGLCLCPLHHKYSRFVSAHKGGLQFFYWLYTRDQFRVKLLLAQLEDIQMSIAPEYAANDPLPTKNYKLAYEMLTEMSQYDPKKAAANAGAETFRNKTLTSGSS